MILLLTIIEILNSNSIEKKYHITIYDMTNGWVTPDGEVVSLDQPPQGDLVLTHSLEGMDKDNKRFCMTSTDTHIRAVFDSKQTYQYIPKLSSLLGESYGMYIHMIVIPPNAEEVTLYLHSIYEFKPVCVGNLAIEDAGMFMGDLYHENLPGFVFCLLIVLFGALMLVIGFIEYGAGNRDALQFFSLGTFVVLIGVWSSNDTLILQIFTQRPELIRFIIYLCIIFVPYPPVSFIANITNRKDTALRYVMLFLVMLNFIVTMALSLLELSDIRRMLCFSHANVIIAIVILVYLLATAVRHREIDKRMLNMILIGMGAVIVGALLDIIRFQLFPSGIYTSSLYTRIGVFIFIVMVGLHLLRERRREAVERGQAELMKIMAYTDGLTELANRAAFHEREKEIADEGRACHIVQLDVNLLKQVNDVYGHAEGDRHIVSAAHAIRDSFAGIGTAYRTGGDEFIVIVEDVDGDGVAQALEGLEQAAATYNENERPPVPLQIAYGFARYQPEAMKLKEAEKLADERMYEKKKAMKAAQD